MVGYASCLAGLKNNWSTLPIGRKNRHRFPDFQVIDLFNDNLLSTLTQQRPPDLLINLAAMTNHTECQNNQDLAKKLHVEAPKILSRWSDKEQFKLIHISTEAVYGYSKERPLAYNESDPCEPQGVYACTKLAGEAAILENNPLATVLRCTPVGFSPYSERTTLFEWVIQELKKGQGLTGYSNAWFTPVSSFSLADLLFNQSFHALSGCYNWGIQDPISKYDFARLVAQELGYPDDIVTPSSASSDGKIMNGALDSSILRSLLKAPPYDSLTMVKELVSRYIHHTSNQSS